MAAAATQELVVKEEVAQEAGDHDDDEIPQLVPVQTAASAELKVMV